MKPHYFYRRRRIPGRVAVFTDPGFDGFHELRERVERVAGADTACFFHPLITREWVGRFPQKGPWSRGWYQAYTGTGLTLSDIDKIGTAPAPEPVDSILTRKQQEAMALARTFGCVGPVELVVENREVIPVAGPENLEQILRRFLVPAGE